MMSRPSERSECRGLPASSCARAARPTRAWRHLLVALLLVALVFARRPLRAQEREIAERRLLASAAVRWTEPLSDIAGVRELADGRVIVLDTKEQRLALVDLVAGTSRPIGAKGKGPGEFSRALRLVALPGDSTIVVDPGAGRLLVLGPDGVPNGVITTFGEAAAAAGLGITAVRDVDLVGGIYFQGRVGKMTDTGFEQPDSARLLRFDRRSGRVDSLVNVAIPTTKVTIAKSGGKITSVNIERPPFSVGDEWAVGDDGRVAVARRSPFRLDLISRDLRTMRGPEVPAAERKVDDADKTEYLANREGGASIDRATLDWPERMPIFLPGAVITVPNGETWVRRTATVDAPSRRYDVFDATGKRVAQVVTAASQRIVLVTARGVYVARSDDDGLQYLERFALPR